VLRKTFGPKREEVTGGWRRLHNEELYDLYLLSGIIDVMKKRVKWVGHVAHIATKISAYRVVVGTLIG
jgi:hypothetical protein